MSTIDKRIYIDTLRQRLGDIVTANDMERVLKVADDVLIDFDVRAIGQNGEDIDSEQLVKPVVVRQRVEIRVSEDMYELPDEQIRGF